MPISASAVANVDSIVGLAPAPATPATDELISTVTKAVEQASGSAPVIRCRDQLDPALQERVRKSALANLEVIVSNPIKLDEVGVAALAEINQTSNQLFTLFMSGDRVKIPEVNQYTKELRRAVKGFNEKNDRNTKRRQNIESYDKSKTLVVDWFYRNVDWLGELISDAQGIERRLDSIVAQITDKQAQLRRNVEICNTLYEVNERAIVNLVIAIAGMEYLHDELRTQHDAIVIDKNAPDARVKSEQKERLRSTVEAVETRINEFNQRLFLAVATSPQIRNIRTISYSLGQRLGLIINVTIPAFKLTVVQWATLIQAQQAATVTEGVVDFNNDVLQGFAAAANQSIKHIAKVSQTPSTSPETILLIAESLDQQVVSFDEAYKWGVEERRKVDESIATAQQIIVLAPEKRTAQLTKLVSYAREIEAPAAPELPAEIDEVLDAA